MLYYRPGFFSFTESKEDYSLTLEEKAFQGKSLNHTIFHDDKAAATVIIHTLWNSINFDLWLLCNPDIEYVVFHIIFIELPKSSGLSCSECLWNVLTVSAGAMDCTGHAMGISKIVNSIILPLADNGVSLFCMSTYQGDFILVNKCTS